MEQRTRDILKLLLQEKNFRTTADIAEKLSVSAKTVSRQLPKVEEILNGVGLQLENCFFLHQTEIFSILNKGCAVELRVVENVQNFENVKLGTYGQYFFVYIFFYQHFNFNFLTFFTSKMFHVKHQYNILFINTLL